jgi:hypothetical protein
LASRFGSIEPAKTVTSNLPQPSVLALDLIFEFI